MKSNDIFLLGGLGIIGYLIYQQMQNPSSGQSIFSTGNGTVASTGTIPNNDLDDDDDGGLPGSDSSGPTTTSPNSPSSSSPTNASTNPTGVSNPGPANNPTQNVDPDSGDPIGDAASDDSDDGDD